MSLFGTGRIAAITLRQRILERLGAEPEWITGDPGDNVIGWMASPLTTFLQVEDGPDDAPNLAVLRVMTPFAEVGDLDAALKMANEKNSYAAASRWVVYPIPRDGQEDLQQLRVTSSFVVGPHNLASLEAFVAWAVKEQIAVATSELNPDIMQELRGEPWLLTGPDGESVRNFEESNAAVLYYEREIVRDSSVDSGTLVTHVQEAFQKLRAEMLDEGTGAWYWNEESDQPLNFQIPAAWNVPSDGEIRWNPEMQSSPPTVDVVARPADYAHLGTGLLITAYAYSYHTGSDATANALNLSDDDARRASHCAGAWMRTSKDSALYAFFLPATLLNEEDIDWPFVMREVLLTFTRQAQLARGVLFKDDRILLTMFGTGPFGLAATRKPHGLAWGETGEGRDPVAWHLDTIYETLVGQDSEWSYPSDNGFTWWPYQHAQRIEAVGRGNDTEISDIVRVRVATDVRANVEQTTENLIVIAKRNASLADAESALVLNDDSTLVLASQFVMTEALTSGDDDWITGLAIRQFVTARELAEELQYLGTDAASAHPVSGPRPEPDYWFGKFAEDADEAAKNDRADKLESRPQIALVAAGGQYALPYRLTANNDGSLDYSWRPEHTQYDVPADPEIRVTAIPGADESGAAWTIRTILPIDGDEAAKARWCQERNTDLLLAAKPSMELMAFGGWGLSADGECCLTMGQARRIVRGDEREAVHNLGYLLRELQSATVAALRAAPEVVHEIPLTAAELAAGLDTLPTAFGRLFGETPTRPWSTVPQETGVRVTCGDITEEVPVGYGRAPLALIYGDLLAYHPNGRPWLPLFAPFPDPTVSRALRELEQGGMIWRDESSDWVFDAGRTRARLEVAAFRDQQRFGDAAGLAISSVCDDVRVSGIGAIPQPLRVQKTIPPAQYAWAIQPTAVDVVVWVASEVIAQVRSAVRQDEQSRKPTPPARPRPRLFGSGLYAATALRSRLLELLGAEPEWTHGDARMPWLAWKSGPATTFFRVSEGGAATPDLGVLRVYTPIALCGNTTAAVSVCAELNARTGTAHWSMAREQDSDGSYHDEIQVSCAFVVGPHNQDTMESFALWCVREQIARATAMLQSGAVAEAIDGVGRDYTGFPAGDERSKPHPVTSFLSDVVAPSASLSADVLAEELLEAFRSLRSRMHSEGTGAWYTDHDEAPITCEMPFTWDHSPDGLITTTQFDENEGRGWKPPTALMESTVTEHPDLGNGLRITVHVPNDPRGHEERAMNELNRLDVTTVAGSSHSIGGWAVTGVIAAEIRAPGCEIFLPAAFAEKVAHRPLVMREILLTLARQALLARRVLVPAESRADEDWDDGLGLSVAADPLATFVRGPHGLAWGETGEGRNPAAQVLDEIYDKCVGPDAAWADTRLDGFTWWPYQQAQDVSATLRSPSMNDVEQGVSIRVATEVRRGAAVSVASLRAIAKLNAELGQSALVLRPDGLLYLAFRLYVHEGTDRWAQNWARNLVAEQFIMARDVSDRLAGLGDFDGSGGGGFGREAVSAHPFSGPRPAPDELFELTGTRAENAGRAVAGLGPLVPLLALGRLYTLPLELSTVSEDGSLTFAWRPSQVRDDLPVDPVIRGSVTRGDVGSGPGWIIRHIVPATGDEDARAAWCNERNAELLADGDDTGADRTIVGGWGLMSSGECCLTTWLSPYLIAGEGVITALGLVGNVLSYQQVLVMRAIAADLDAVTGSPLTPDELAQGLSSVLTAIAASLQYAESFRWSVHPGTDDVVVVLTGPQRNILPSPTMAPVLPLASAEETEPQPRTVLRIPLARNRPQLGLLYAAFLGRSSTRISSNDSQLIPGEDRDWDFTWQHIEQGLGPLDDEGLLNWDKSLPGFTFDAGSRRAVLSFEFLEDFRDYGGTALRLTGTIPDLDPAQTLSLLATASLARLSNDVQLIGTWQETSSGLSYEVTIPPAGMVFGTNYIVGETAAWVARHIVTQVRTLLS